MDPLWIFSKDEARRICHVYEEEMGIMYPFLSLDQALILVERLYTGPGPGSPEHAGQGSTHAQGSNEYDANLLKMAFACALTAQGGGRNDIALKLFQSVLETANKYVWGPPELGAVMVLLLVVSSIRLGLSFGPVSDHGRQSICYFHMDEEALSWRIFGIVARMALELGLHRRETLKEPEIMAFGQSRAVRLFWSIYVLDMRWSLGTGMPFALQIIDIDPKLPEPVSSAVSMVMHALGLVSYNIDTISRPTSAIQNPSLDV
jgi:hypothetical protein